MSDVIITGASRGIGRALALAHARTQPNDRLVLVARDAAALDALAAEVGGSALVLPADLSSIKQAHALGEQLATLVKPGATLVHNAGLWPAKKVLTEDGVEQAYAVNHLGPLLLQRPLFAKQLVSRVLVVSAGLMARGRFDPFKTPKGDDFSALGTYCSTKLAFAVAMRELARMHPELDVAVVHPGVVRTDLGARRGPLGWVMKLVKRSWESPEACAFRLEGFLSKSTRWSRAGDARWFFEADEQPWPSVVDTPNLLRAVEAATAASIGPLHHSS